MDDTNSIKDQQIPETAVSEYLLDMSLPSISLPNQFGNLLQINRKDNFRLVIYFFSMTGHPNKMLPQNWKKIPGAEGCTLENCNFRDKYENLIQLNSLPIGISTQTVDDIKEMTNRLNIKYDILSDSDLICAKKLSLPTFSINNKTFLKRLTIIVEKNIIKKVFYPVVSINKHIENILKWLQEN